MNISKFTQKSVQAVQDLEKVAYEYGNQEVEQEHLLYALLTQEDSLIPVSYTHLSEIGNTGADSGITWMHHWKYGETWIE